MHLCLAARLLLIHEKKEKKKEKKKKKKEEKRRIKRKKKKKTVPPNPPNGLLGLSVPPPPHPPSPSIIIIQHPKPVHTGMILPRQASIVLVLVYTWNLETRKVEYCNYLEVIPILARVRNWRAPIYIVRDVKRTETKLLSA